MTKSTDMMAPAGTTHTIKSEFKKSPLWPRIKALGNKCFYFNGSQWMDILDENYLDYYLKFYNAVTHEAIPTETPEEAEAFNKMKPYEFDEHVSGDAKIVVEGKNGDKIVYTEKEVTIGSGVETDRHSSGFLGRCITIPNRPVFKKAEFNKPVFTQAMADAGELPPVGSDFKVDGDEDCDDGYCYLKCVAHHIEGGVIGQDNFSRMHWICSAALPLDTRTSKQKAVDEMYKAWDLASVGDEVLDVCEALYHAGYEKKC